MAQLGNTLSSLLLSLVFKLQTANVRCQYTLEQSVLLIRQIAAFVPFEQRPDEFFLVIVQP